MEFMEQRALSNDGTPCQYLCHIQEVGQDGLTYPAHYHDYIELLYGLSGTFQVYLNGNFHEFKEGDLVLINSREVHQIEARYKDGGRYIVLRFLPDLIYNSMTQTRFEFKYVLPFISENYQHEKVIRDAILKDTEIPALLDEIMREYDAQSYGYELAIKNNIGRIFLWLLRYWYRQEETLPSDSIAHNQLVSQLKPALQYVMDHYEKEISAADMAKLCGMSYSYFSRTFTRVMKIHFSDYVNYTRIAAAEKLLVSSDLTITEVGANVGFSTTSYFIKQFRHYRHISPKQFQKQLGSS